MGRILIMSCGQRKLSDTRSLPALQRYDGPSFRLLRRYLASHPGAPLDVFVLSARFGLIPATQPIPNYDQRITRERAHELWPSVRAALEGLFAAQPYDNAYLAIGKDYLLAIAGYENVIPRTTTVSIASGSQGKRLAELHDWLYGAPPAPRTAPRPRQPATEGAQIRGFTVTLTADEARKLASRALEGDREGASSRYHAWYVSLDGRRVAPKWLVTQITGLGPSAFTTDDARRLLIRMGIEVLRA